MTRLAFDPTTTQPQVPERVPSARYVELQGIRRRLSLSAARLTLRPETLERGIGEIEAELVRLKELAKEQPT